MHFQFSHVWSDLRLRIKVGQSLVRFPDPLVSRGTRLVASLGRAVARADDGRAADNGHLLMGQQVGEELVVVEEVVVVASAGGMEVVAAGIKVGRG